MKADRLHKFNSLPLPKLENTKQTKKNMIRALLCSSSGGKNCITLHLVSSHSVGRRPVRSTLSIIVGWPCVLL